MSISTKDPVPSITARLLQMLQNQGFEILDHRLQTNAVSIGYNFCSGIVKLQVRLRRSDGVLEEKSFVLKIPSQCPFYDQLSALNMYRNEVLMYSHILPAVSELAECDWIANCYLLPDSDNLVFDDLTADGYELMDKKSQLDLAHSELATRTLAKLHALSVKLYEISKETSEVIKVPPRQPAANEGAPSAIFQRFENTVRMLKVPERVRRAVRHFVQKNTKVTFDETMITSKRLNVLCHGDYWLGNMLFKHNHRGEVDGVKILDFQMAHWCSPVVDLIKFFVTSIQFDVYRANHDVLIETYLGTLNSLLESLKSSARYNRDDLDRDMRRYKRYYLYCLGHYLTSVLNEEDPFNHGINDVKCYTSPLYQDALLKWIRHLDDEYKL